MERRLRRIITRNFISSSAIKYKYLQKAFVKDESLDRSCDESSENYKELVVRPLLRKIICWTEGLINQKKYKKHIAGISQYIYEDIFFDIEAISKDAKSLSGVDHDSLSKSYCKHFKKRRPFAPECCPDQLVVPEQLTKWCLTGIVQKHLEAFKESFDSSCQKWIKEHLNDQEADQLYTGMFKVSNKYSINCFFQEQFMEAIQSRFEDDELKDLIFLLPVEEYEVIAKEVADQFVHSFSEN